MNVIALRLENRWQRPRRLTATYYAEWVLGTTARDPAVHHSRVRVRGPGALLARNPYNRRSSPERVAFCAGQSAAPRLTADRTEFLGRMGDLRKPAALGRIGLEGTVQAGLDPCAAVQLHVELAPGEAKESATSCWAGGDREDGLRLARQVGQDPRKRQGGVGVGAGRLG